MAKYTQAGRPISINVPTLKTDELLLEKVQGTEGIGQPFRFELELLAEAEVDFGKVLGEKASIRLALPNGTQRTIHGIISRLSQAGWVPGPDGPATFIRYRAELVPALWLLGQRVQTRVFQHRSVKDILTQVLSTEWQLDIAINLLGNYPPRNYCVQYGESDLAFVSRLMEEDGISFFFEFTDSGYSLHVIDNQSLFPDLADPRSIVYDPSEGARKATPRIRDWEKTQELRPYKFMHRDYCFEVPDHDLSAERQTAQDGTVSVGKVKHALSHQRTISGVQMLERYEYPADFAQRYDGIDKDGGDAAGDLAHLNDDKDHLAQVRLEEQIVQSLVVKGSSDCGHFLPGHKFQLERHFDSANPPGAGDSFLLTRVEVSASVEGSYQSAETSTFVYANHFVCLPAGLTYRPARTTPRPRAFGPETAVVIGPPGEDIYCDKYGRVKVHFRWDRDTGDKNDSSCWIRVTQPWAGQTWGALTLPRVGQEVVVAFEAGNPDRPVIQGSLYNAKQMPPYQLPNERRQSGLVSSSGKGNDQYHELRFDDTEGKEMLYMHSQRDTNQESERNHRIQVGHDQLSEVSNNQFVNVGNVHQMSVAGSYSLYVGQQQQGSGAGGGDAADFFTGGVAPITSKNVMNTFVFGSSATLIFGNQFFLFAGGREEVRIGAQLNLFGPSLAVLNANIALAIANFTVARTYNFVYGPTFTFDLGTRTWINPMGDLKAKVNSLSANVDDNMDAFVRTQQVILQQLNNCADSATVNLLRQEYNTTKTDVTQLQQQEVALEQRVTTGEQTIASLGPQVQTLASDLEANTAVLVNHNASIIQLQGGVIIL
jgi:type VI secretion system secreted protein VgrG